jgi:nitrate reductase gamma subunit
MNETTGSFLFRGWPYLALALAAAGFAIRLLLTGDRVPALRRATPRARAVFIGGRPWIAAWLLLAVGHAAGLLFPRAVLSWTRTPWHVVALEAAGFAIGLGALATAVRGAWLHMRRPSRSGWSLAADFADSVFLSFLFIAAASGLLAASMHRWGSQWAAVTMAPYVASLLHGRPVPAFVEHLPFVVRLHLCASFAAIACLPATRLAVLPLMLAHRAFVVAGRALTGVAQPLRAWVQRRPAALLWPDHEVRWVAAPRAEGAAARPAGPAAARWPVVAPVPVNAGGAKPTRSKAV